MRRLETPFWLVAALLCGWLAAFFNILSLFVSWLEQALGISQGASIPLLIVILPPILGVVAACIIGREKQHPILLAMGIGLLALTGWYGYWYPAMLHADTEAIAACHGSNPPPSCSHGLFNPESYINTNALVWSWFIGAVLVALGSGVTGWLLSFVRKHRSKKAT